MPLLSTYVKLYLGMSVTDKEMDVIAEPQEEILSHVTNKTLQMGVLGGTMYGLLFSALRKSTRNHDAMVILVQRYVIRGGVAGALCGPCLMMGYCQYYMKMNNNQLFDRAYRLRQNSAQFRVDRTFQAGLLTGGIISLFAGSGLMFGAAIGGSSGLLTMTLLNKKGIFDI